MPSGTRLYEAAGRLSAAGIIARAAGEYYGPGNRAARRKARRHEAAAGGGILRPGRRGGTDFRPESEMTRTNGWIFLRHCFCSLFIRTNTKHAMNTKIAFFGAKPYDRESFDKTNEAFGFDIRYYKGHLTAESAVLAKGSAAVCIFVNDTADAETVEALKELRVPLIALRCAGFNNVDLEAAARNGITVVRVPAYSPYAVAEHLWP